MVEKKIRFASSGQLMSFCNTCQRMKSDIDVTDMSNRNFRIDGKSLLGLMSIKLGLPMRLVVSGEDEDLAHQYFTNFEMESSSLAGLAALMGHRAMTVCCIIAGRVDKNMNTSYKGSMQNLINMVLDRI